MVRRLQFPRVTDLTSDPRADSPLGVVWRRKWLVLAVVVLGTAAAAIVSKTLDPVYEAESRLLVVQSSDRQSFDAVQAAQVTARTYSEVLDSANLARTVAGRLGGGTTLDEVQAATTFEPIPETQLLRIGAEAPTARGAQRMANTYAQVFEAYAAQRLRPTTQATVSIADLASLPAAPSRPKPTLYVMLAALLSLAIGIALAFVRDRFDTRVEGADELERAFGLPLLARVPRRGTTQEAASSFAEAFRMLRVAVAFSSPGGSPRSVLVTSAQENKGKTTTARQLALAAAEAGQRVIAVEADVYRPSLGRMLNFASDGGGGGGLTRYLLGQTDLDDVIEPTGAPNVDFISAGPAPLSLASLLETERGRTFIADLERRADLVVLDCPPIGPRADAVVLAARAEATVIVVDTSVSTRQRLNETLRALRSVRANVIGVVLNRTSSGVAYSPYLAEGEREPAAVGARGPRNGA
jgi:capsular exopolysaccharide synthesis family protein